MTRVKDEADIGMAGWKVRIVIGGAIVHVFTETEPVVTMKRIGEMQLDVIASVELRTITGTAHGDTLGFIRWADVSAISWRRA